MDPDQSDPDRWNRMTGRNRCIRDCVSCPGRLLQIDPDGKEPHIDGRTEPPPRGANGRNAERNVNRNNANRLYDTQNNAKGGYATDRAVGGPQPATAERADGERLPQ